MSTVTVTDLEELVRYPSDDPQHIHDETRSTDKVIVALCGDSALVEDVDVFPADEVSDSQVCAECLRLERLGA